MPIEYKSSVVNINDPNWRKSPEYQEWLRCEIENDKLQVLGAKATLRLERKRLKDRICEYEKNFGRYRLPKLAATTVRISNDLKYKSRRILRRLHY